MLAPAYNAQGPPAAPAPLPRSACRSTRSRSPTSTPSGVARPAAPISGPRRQRRRLVRDAGVRSRRRHLGHRRAAGAADAVLGLEPGGRREDADPDADGRRACTTSRCRRSACGSSTPISVPKEKVFIDLGCSSHNAMWEKNHLLLFRASLEWLTAGRSTDRKRACSSWDTRTRSNLIRTSHVPN